MFCPRLSTHAVVGILNKRSFPGTGQEWPPSSPNTRRRGGHHALAMAKSTEQGVIQHQGLRAISFVGAMPFQMPRLSMSSDAILASVDLNVMFWMAMWALAGRRQQDIKNALEADRDLEKMDWEGAAVSWEEWELVDWTEQWRFQQRDRRK